MITDEETLNGRYQIKEKIGHGGMADVYLATDLLLKRPVAVKILFKKFSDDQSFVERFRREAQAAANLNHPNIVAVHDYGQHDSTYFIVMEYVEGQTLSDCIASTGGLDTRSILEVVSGVAAGLGFAHQHGIVHRDVKPGNIMITKDGRPKVSDFGIARAMNDDATDLTQAGSIVGTAAYFSPEQAQGQKVDARSDLYSLGVVIFQMISGVLPFSADSSFALALKHIQEEPPLANTYNPQVPDTLVGLVSRLLKKSPDSRFQTSEDLIQTLQSISDDMSSSASKSESVDFSEAAEVANPITPSPVVAPPPVAEMPTLQTPPPPSTPVYSNDASVQYPIQQSVSTSFPPIPDGRVAAPISQKKSSTSTFFLVTILLIGVVAAGVGGFWFLNKRGGEDTSENAAKLTQTETDVADDVVQEPTREEISVLSQGLQDAGVTVWDEQLTASQADCVANQMLTTLDFSRSADRFRFDSLSNEEMVVVVSCLDKGKIFAQNMNDDPYPYTNFECYANDLEERSFVELILANREGRDPAGFAFAGRLESDLECD